MSVSIQQQIEKIISEYIRQIENAKDDAELLEMDPKKIEQLTQFAASGNEAARKALADYKEARARAESNAHAKRRIAVKELCAEMERKEPIFSVAVKRGVDVHALRYIPRDDIGRMKKGSYVMYYDMLHNMPVYAAPNDFLEDASLLFGALTAYKQTRRAELFFELDAGYVAYPEAALEGCELGIVRAHDADDAEKRRLPRFVFFFRQQRYAVVPLRNEKRMDAHESSRIFLNALHQCRRKEREFSPETFREEIVKEATISIADLLQKRSGTAAVCVNDIRYNTWADALLESDGKTITVAKTSPAALRNVFRGRVPKNTPCGEIPGWMFAWLRAAAKHQHNDVAPEAGEKTPAQRSYISREEPGKHERRHKSKKKKIKNRRDKKYRDDNDEE